MSWSDRGRAGAACSWLSAACRRFLWHEGGLPEPPRHDRPPDGTPEPEPGSYRESRSGELGSFHTLLGCAKPENMVQMNELFGMMVNTRLYAVALLRAWNEVA